jgi:sec-independent protein translocase protein TatA
MGGFSLVHWIILGIVILLLFGGNRFSAMMGDVAKGLKSFKQGMSDDEKTPERPGERPGERRLGQDRPIDLTPEPPRAADSSPPPPPANPDDNRA